jgi:hypothetical protein
MITWILLFAVIATCITAALGADPGSRRLVIAPLMVGAAAMAIAPLAQAMPSLFGGDPGAVAPILQTVVLAAALALALHVLNTVRTERLNRIANEDGPDLEA